MHAARSRVNDITRQEPFLHVRRLTCAITKQAAALQAEQERPKLGFDPRKLNKKSSSKLTGKNAGSLYVRLKLGFARGPSYALYELQRQTDMISLNRRMPSVPKDLPLAWSMA
jgi:hypothetical protein